MTIYTPYNLTEPELQSSNTPEQQPQVSNKPELHPQSSHETMTSDTPSENASYESANENDMHSVTQVEEPVSPQQRRRSSRDRKQVVLYDHHKITTCLLTSQRM